MSPVDAPILCIGEALIDFIASDGEGSLETATTFIARDGGAPANVAVALARLGVPSAFVGAVGDDPFGSRLITGLAQRGVNTDFIARRSIPTTLAFAWKDERGDGHFRLLRNADVDLEFNDIAPALERAAAIVVGSVALAAESSRSAVVTAASRAETLGVPVCFDVNLRPTLWPDLVAAREACIAVQRSATLVKLSLDDARGLFPGVTQPEAVFAELDAIHRVPIAVLTDGARGCWYRSSSGDIRFQTAFEVEAVEPTGAGDAFLGALLSRLIAHAWRDPDDDDIRFAAAAGALATLRPGAWDGQPAAGELAQFLDRSPAPSA